MMISCFLQYLIRLLHKERDVPGLGRHRFCTSDAGVWVVGDKVGRVLAGETLGECVGVE